jgi:hypothetical protein
MVHGFQRKTEYVNSSDRWPLSFTSLYVVPPPPTLSFPTYQPIHSPSFLFLFFHFHIPPHYLFLYVPNSYPPFSSLSPLFPFYLLSTFLSPLLSSVPSFLTTFLTLILFFPHIPLFSLYSSSLYFSSAVCLIARSLCSCKAAFVKQNHKFQFDNRKVYSLICTRLTITRKEISATS